MRIPRRLPQAGQWASGKVGSKICKLLTLKPALNPLGITHSSNQTSETTISRHLLCKFPWGTSRHSLFLHLRLSKTCVLKRNQPPKARSEPKMHSAHAFILVARWFGCWNWPVIENKRCLLQKMSNFHLLGKMFFHDENHRERTQLNYFHLPTASVTLFLIQWLARIHPLAQWLFLDVLLDFQ